MLLYHLLSFILIPIYLVIILVRILVGKENIARVQERFSFGSKRKNQNFLIWMHAASVGESRIALTLVQNIHIYFPNVEFLVTTWTNSSAKILSDKLPEFVLHQFLPIDNIIFVRKFLKNWRPNLGIFIESELWPCTISEGTKFCKLLLLNARLSDKSFQSWQKGKFFFQTIVNNFSKVIVQSEADLHKFHELGITNAVNLDNIKSANKKLEVDPIELIKLSSHFKNKQLVVFASTHPEDEEVILPIIKKLKQQFLNSYFILIPRHPERVKSIINNCKILNLSVNTRSKSSLPILDKDLYIIDKFGEIGLFFSLANISFIGGSFKQGGHNILEPGHFSNCIIFGPDMSKNIDIVHNILKSNAAIQVKNQADLLTKLQHLLNPNNHKELTTYQHNAYNFVQRNQSILNDYLAIISKYIN